jgi:four helix bundle protein
MSNYELYMENLKDRTKKFALRIIKLVNSLPKDLASKTIGNQLIRCGTSVAANYRAACRARSKAEFIAKLGIVEEEADESIFWIEMLIEAGLINVDLVDKLLQENNEILAIIVASKKTARKTK